jgi:hypothetical protein
MKGCKDDFHLRDPPVESPVDRLVQERFIRGSSRMTRIIKGNFVIRVFPEDPRQKIFPRRRIKQLRLRMQTDKPRLQPHKKIFATLY